MAALTSLPVPPNTLFDLFRNGVQVTLGLKGYLVPKMITGRHGPQLTGATGPGLLTGSEYTGLKFTHVMLVPASIDIRDGWAGKTTAYSNLTRDEVYVPDFVSGALYKVNYVEVINRATALEMKRVYLERQIQQEVATPVG